MTDLSLLRDKDQEELALAFIRMLRRRVHSKNMNLNIIVLGESGNGKSYISMKLAEVLDRDFNIDRVLFDAIKFAEIIQDERKLKRGSCIVFEELGVNAYNRSWFTDMNKCIDHVFQTFRHLNLITIANVPYEDFIDSHLRDQFHIKVVAQGVKIVKIEGWEHSRKFAEARFYIAKKDPISSYKYRVTPRIATFDGVVELNPVYLALPSKKLIEAYEKLMSDWKRKVRDKFLNTLSYQSGAITQKSMSYDDVKDIFLKNPTPYLKWVKSRKMYKIDKDLLKTGFKLTRKEVKGLESKLLLEQDVLKILKPEEKPKEYWELENVKSK